MDSMLRRERLKRVVVRAAVPAVLLAVGLMFSASIASGAVPFDSSHFIAAIREASVPEPSAVHTHLFALSNANPQLEWRPGTNRQQLMVVAVMRFEDYRKYYASGSGTTPSSRPVLWVTLAPELRSWCRHFARRIAGTSHRRSVRDRATVVRRRVVQRLGLSPSVPYTEVVELWVDRSSIFRPCPDPAVADRRCDLQMHGTPQVKGIPDYRSFFASLYVGAYRTDGAPWTRLGYTYDWGASSRFGASEYMLTTSTRYDVRTATTIPRYCR